MSRSRWLSAFFLAVFSLALGPDVRALPSTSAADAPFSQSSAHSGVWYEIFVRAWYDTNGDGIGDLNGVTAKLDYLKSLGVDGIWLMPINASPSYHGYDVTDYEAINPEYGTMQDFERLVSEAHKRHIQVIMDLVINHTSNRHPWFVAALDPKSPYRRWYTWATPGTDLKALSATDSPAWHEQDGQYFLGDFSRGMPDLNYDEPAVRREMIDVGKFWLAKGVDGFRLDAARHIYDDLKTDTGKPATTRKNVAWWNEFRQGLKQVRPDVYLVGEATMPTPAALAPYMQSLGSVFDFPLAEQMIQSVSQEQAAPLAQLLDRSYAAFRKTSGQDAPFLSNHDQERVFSRLNGSIDRMRVAAAILLTLPGHPFVYYGEELGVLGRKPDENLREPMRWERDPAAAGQSHWKPVTSGQGGDVSVQAEQDDPHSLLNFYRTLIHWRIEQPLLRDGDLRTIPVQNACILAFERFHGERRVLVIHNLSGKAQSFKLPGSWQAGHVVLEAGQGASASAGTVTLPAYDSAVLR
ncbi:MAG TPA: alpha-amylase family glycosyl hydrolase [Dyella sp.]|uniref:alpha-amylase family glycosyl hydrolase n=1 Tax=Dyella sp. TaxID=1869338 RepID=UPI002F94601F